MTASATHPGSAFWDRIAERYSRRPIADEAAYEKKLKVTREYLRPDMTVLELGCGTGGTALLHAPYVRHIRAIDISRKMIEIAWTKAAAEGTDNVSFERATLDELSIPAESFDAVLGLNVLHLLPNKEATIARVYELLRPGGVFVTSTACLAGLAKAWPLRLVLPIGRLLGRLPLVRFFTRAQLADSLTDAGFSIDYEWQPGKGKAVFMVAKKPE